MTKVGPAAAILAPLLVGGAALVITGASFWRRLSGSETDSLHRAQRLARAINGNDKHSIAAALGPPQGSSGTGSPQSAFLASSWYYRLDARHRIAIAIEFENDIACEVRVLHIKLHRAADTPAVRRSATV